MNIPIKTILNPGILNDEWINFQGDSEYIDAEGNLQLGMWSFIGITEDPQGETPFTLEDSIPEEALYENYIFVIKNKQDHICMVKFHYNKN